MKIFAKLVKIKKRSFCCTCDKAFPRNTEMYWAPSLKRVKCKECYERHTEKDKQFERSGEDVVC